MRGSGPNSVTADGATDEVTEDRLLGGAVRLLQPRRGHRAGTDAVLLAALAGARPEDRVVDLGSASGAVGLMVAARTGAHVQLVERDPALAALAERNIALNGWSARMSALVADAFAPRRERQAAGLASGTADLVVTNPPFFESASHRASPDPGRRAGHAMAGGDLAGWIKTAADLLRPRGRLVLIHRADHLANILAALTAGSPAFGTIRIMPIQARAETDAIRVVVAAVKGGAAPLSLAPALVLHGAEGGFTPEAARLHAL
jgi:tRNA1(Val) A37 N6-methylase TrmN6